MLVKNLGWELPVCLILLLVVGAAAALGADGLATVAMWTVAFLTPAALLSGSLRLASALRR